MNRRITQSYELRAFTTIAFVLIGCAVAGGCGPSLQQLIEEERWAEAKEYVRRATPEEKHALELAEMERRNLRLSVRTLSSEELEEFCMGPVPETFTVVEVRTRHLQIDGVDRQNSLALKPFLDLTLRRGRERRRLGDGVPLSLRNPRQPVQNPDTDIHVLAGRAIDAVSERLTGAAPDGPVNPGAEAAARARVRPRHAVIDPVAVLNRKLMEEQCEQDADEVSCTFHRMLDSTHGAADERPDAILIRSWGQYAIPLSGGADLTSQLAATFASPIRIERSLESPP